MNKLIRAGLVLGAFVATAPAYATTFVIETNDPVNTGTNSGNVYGNSRVFTTTVGNETLSVKATAWSRTTNAVSAAYLGQWTDPGTGSGLGVLTSAENSSTAPSASHTIDNKSGYDFIVLQFSQAVTLTGGILNAYTLGSNTYKDNDAFVGVDSFTGAWNKDLTSSLTSWSTISSGLTKSINTVSNGAAGQSFAMSGTTGNLWIIGAATAGDKYIDSFKLAQITAVTAVPEPATWAMMLVGFGMVGAAARYRRRKTGAVIA